MTRHEWPPGGRDDEGGVVRPANVQASGLIKPPSTPTATLIAGRHFHASRAGDVWREGFSHGFRDALRLAQRRIDDPEVWAVLDRLADDYSLAGEP